MEREALFLSALERLQTLYPGDYAWGATSTHEGAEQQQNLDVKLRACTHPGAAGINSFLGGGDPPPPTQPSSLVGAATDSLPVTQKLWLGGGSSNGGQENFRLSTFAGAEDVLDGGKGGEGVGVTEHPPPPPNP